MNSMNRTPLLLMVVSSFLSGAGWICSKEVIAELPPFAFVGSRFLCAALLLLPLAWLREPLPTPPQLLRASGSGILLSISFLLWVTALSQSEALGSGAFVMSLAPLIAPIAAWAIFKAKPTYHYWITLPLAIIGLLLLASGTQWGVSISLYWFLGAATTMGIQLAVHRQLAQSIPPTWLTTIQLSVIGVLGLSLSLLFEKMPESVSSSTWLWFLASVLLATSMRYQLLTLALRQMTTAHASLLMLLEPVATLVCSILFYGESLSGTKLAGAALVIGALVFNQLPGMIRASRR